MPPSTRRALVWSFAERYLSVLITIGSTLVLARLLTPTQVGIYSVCAAFTAVAGILRDFGVSEYLIQERELTRQKIRACHGVAIVVAWTLGGAIFLGRHGVAGFFDEPAVAEVLAVLALHFLLLPLSSPAFALLNREMAFRQIALLQTACTVAQALTTLALAWRGHGTLALAWGPVVGVALQAVLLTAMRPRDSLVLPGLRDAGAVLRFGTVYMGSRIVETLSRHVHEPVIARSFDFAAVGLYSRAQGMIEMFHANVADAVVRVATPAFAARHRDGQPVAQAWAHATGLFVCVSWPFFGFVALTATELIGLLFGPQWTAAAPIAVMLAMAALPGGLHEMVPQLLSATGHVHRRLRLALWVGVLHIAGVLLAAQWGLVAVAAVSLVSSLAMLALSLQVLRTVLGLSVRELLRPSASSAMLAAGALAAMAAVSFGSRAAGLPAAGVVLGTMLAGAAVWLALARGLGHPAYHELLSAAAAGLRRGRQAFETR